MVGAWPRADRQLQHTATLLGFWYRSSSTTQMLVLPRHQSEVRNASGTGMMKKKMETSKGCIGIILGLYRAYIGIMERKMETTIIGYICSGCPVSGIRGGVLGTPTKLKSRYRLPPSLLSAAPIKGFQTTRCTLKDFCYNENSQEIAFIQIITIVIIVIIIIITKIITIKILLIVIVQPKQVQRPWTPLQLGEDPAA